VTSLRIADAHRPRRRTAKDVKRTRRHEVLETLQFIMQHDERIDL
jgi:hypothetical protein